MRVTGLIYGIGAAILALVAATPAAGSSIKISDGITTLIIADGSVDDADPATGIVAYDGPLGVWDLDLFGEVIVQDGREELYVHDFSASSNSPTATTLTIWFSDLKTGEKSSSIEASIGGLTDGFVTYRTYKGTSEFHEGTLLNSLSFSGSAIVNDVFGGSDGDAFVTDGGEFYLTSKISITHGAGVSRKRTSFDASVAVPDGGTTLSLLGLAMLGIAGVRRFVS